MPLAFRWLVAHGLLHFKPWRVLSEPGLARARGAFRVESGHARDVVVFAHRQDNDDAAGFEVADGRATDRVIVFHPAWSGRAEEWLIEAEYEDLWAFVAGHVVGEMKWWADEAELAEMATRPEPPGGA